MNRPLYRIIDANFNRAREALRVAEEYCRFCLDSKPLSSRAKQMRHRLSGAAAGLDQARLIGARDTLADVGTDIVVDNQLARADLDQAFTAAAKRLTEALRVLAEAVQPIAPPLAEVFEKLRYEAYTFEKDVLTFAVPAQRFSRARLYVLLCDLAPVEIMAMTQYCAKGRADCIQLRMKGISDRQYLELACQFVNLCRENNVISIINDRVDIAVASGADGVHLGRDDLCAQTARKLQTRPMIIGLTTHDSQQLESAIDQRPTYIALGPAFASSTKPALEPAGLDYIKAGTNRLKSTGIASVAIGGITQDNIDQVIAAGVSAAAVSAVITGSSNPVETCLNLAGKFD